MIEQTHNQPGQSGVTSQSIVITGSGGSGAITAGSILLEAVAKNGYFGLMSRMLGPQIRGGESAAMLRLSTHPVECLDDRFDLLVGLDWFNVDSFTDEIVLDAQSMILADPLAGSIPSWLIDTQARVIEMPLQQTVAQIKGGRANMLSLGMIGQLIGLPQQLLNESIHKVLADKTDKDITTAISCADKGYQLISAESGITHLKTIQGIKSRWNISGNEASGLGALRGGVRFVAAYPITPASDMLEWIAPRLEQIGGTLIQAEDELAAINMTIGASFGGVPAMTATSGPGFSLMLEGLGLAVASETPVTLVNVSRGAPSTGIPTKSEQADLNMALYGMHGDAPRLVLAPLTIADCAMTTEWASGLAEHLQTVAIVLLDQFLGQTRVITKPLSSVEQNLKCRTVVPASKPYLRYQQTTDGISPMAFPGMPDCMYTADGLEHDERGIPSSLAIDHQRQLDKRLRKLKGFDFGDRWVECLGDGDICLLTWGSTSGAVFEAARRLRVEGLGVRVIATRLLAPLQRDKLLCLIDNAKRILVVEQNHQAQFYHYLHAQQVLPETAESFARPGPVAFRPGEIMLKIKGVC